MTSRVLRDGLLDSENVAALHDKTFRLYISLFLSADDYGLVETGFGPISRATSMQHWPRELIAKMLGELVDAGLLLPYEVDGKPFAAMAKWEARINSVRPKHPVPSFGMFHVRAVLNWKDERTRIAGSSYIKHLSRNSGTPVVPQCVTSGALVTEGVRGKGEEITTKPNSKTKARSRSRAPDPVAKILVDLPPWLKREDWQAFVDQRAKLKKPMTEEAQRRAVIRLGRFKKDGHDPELVLEASIIGGWQGLFTGSDTKGGSAQDLDALIAELTAKGK